MLNNRLKSWHARLKVPELMNSIVATIAKWIFCRLAPSSLRKFAKSNYILFSFFPSFYFSVIVSP